MNSIERVVNAISLKPTDHIPIIAQVFGHAAILANVPLNQYLQDGELLAQCQIEAWERYRYDAVFALMDVCVETEALGTELEFRDDVYPIIKKYAISDLSELKSRSIPNPNKDGRMPEILKATKKLRKTVGEDVLVVGCALGPMTLTSQLLGLEKTIYAAIDTPEEFSNALDFSVKVCIEFAKAQIKAGAHLLVIFEPSGSPAVVPHNFFREVIAPGLTKICSELKQAGSAGNWLHIAGPTVKILPYYKKIGVDIANIDYYVAPTEAKRILPTTCIDGNIKPISFVSQAPQEIMTESLKLLENFKDRGGFILSSGCEIPLEAKAECIEAMVSSRGK